MITDTPPLMKLNLFGHFLLNTNKAIVMNFSEHELENAKISIRKTTDFYWAFCMLPLAFPKEWGMRNFRPRHYEIDAALNYCVMIYFNLSVREFAHLFKVRQQKPKIYGGVMLNYNAESWELGANIMWFINWKMKNN